MAHTATASLASYLALVKSVPGASITQEQETLLGHFAQYLDTHSGPVASEGSATQYKRPKAGTLTGKVWEIADSLVVGGKAPERKQVVEAGRKQGLNDATITTQWSHWSAAFKAAAEATKAAEAAKAAEETKKGEEQAEAGVGGA